MVASYPDVQCHNPSLPSSGGLLNKTYKWSLIPLFAIVSITGTLKSFGNLIMCEKVNDVKWKQPDTRRIGNSLMADAFCVTVSGLL
jgi:hypothetical protein